MMGNVTLLEFLSMGREVAGHRPWPRYQLDAQGWRMLVEQMSVSNWEILAEWGETAEIHVLLRGEDSGAIAVASHLCPDGAFFALGQVRPSAIRLERAIRDLWGLVPEGLEDQRPWLDHGHWSVTHPLGRPRHYDGGRRTYKFLTAEGDGLHQIPVGPVHAGVIEPGHFRFYCQGETVVRLEERLGYTHKGIEGLVAGKPISDAARIISRVSGDSTVAYAIAFARAVEAALGQEIPVRAHWLRALMAELERIANHLADIGGICNDAAFAIMLAHTSTLREQILNTNAAIFGHRLLMDQVVPGGVARDLDQTGYQALMGLLKPLRRGFKRAVALYDQTPSLLDRTNGTGVVHGTLAHRFAASGVIGRASSRSVDARRHPGYPPYDELEFAIPVLAEGDVHARVQIRFDEIRASLSLIEQILARLPDGAVAAALPWRAGEGVALVESFRGEIAVWVRLSEAGKVVRAHPHDPSWFQWPLLEAAIDGNIVADFPLCNKSFNCSYSGADL